MIELSALDVILLTIMAVIVEALTIFFAYFLIPLPKRVIFANRLLRRNLGIIEVAEKGGDITRYIANFSKRWAEVGNKVFIFVPELVYRKDGVKTIHYNEVDAIDPVSFSAKGTSEKSMVKKLESIGQKVDDRTKGILGRVFKRKVNTVGGKKKIFFFPVSFKKKKPKEEYKAPEIIKSVFMEQKTLSEAQALLSDKMMRYLLIGACVTGALAFATCFMLSDKIDSEVIPAVQGLRSDMKEVKADIVEIKTQGISGSGGIPITQTTIPLILPNISGG